MPDTQSEINADTVEFIPRYTPIPECSIDDHIRNPTNDIIHLLLRRTPAVTALACNTTRHALIKLAQILNRDKTPPITRVAQPPK